MHTLECTVVFVPSDERQTGQGEGPGGADTAAVGSANGGDNPEGPYQGNAIP